MRAVHQAERSYWPIVLAATLAITVAGLLVHLAISIIGLVLSIVAMIAWVAERTHAPVEVQPQPRAKPAVPALGEGERGVEVPAPAKSNSYWGMVWFIATEAMFFANLIAGFLYLRLGSGAWPPPGTPHAELLFSSINTVVLLGSGIPAYLGLRAMKRGDRRGMQLGFAGAALMGAIFLAGQAYEYSTSGLTMQTNIFGASFYTLTGFHGLHVLVGIAFLLVTIGLSARGRFSAQDHFGVEFAGTYWHFVDAVWVVLFTMFYLLR